MDAGPLLLPMLAGYKTAASSRTIRAIVVAVLLVLSSLGID